MPDIVPLKQPVPPEQPEPEAGDVVAGILEDAARVDPPAPTAAAWVDRWRAPGGGE
ncbi:MAG: hypothetical protein HY906_02315 [Deltaproteobacteria bacterium]|nr:hypothetical protein [Deltaproteobacteria bacterium]